MLTDVKRTLASGLLTGLINRRGFLGAIVAAALGVGLLPGLSTQQAWAGAAGTTKTASGNTKKSNNFPMRVGLFCWKAPAQGWPTFIRQAKVAGCSYIAIKTFDGAMDMTPSDLKTRIADAHRAGIRVYTWGYLYGRSPKAETANAMKSLATSDGLILDCEIQFLSKHTWTYAERLTKKLANKRHDKPLTLSSFSRVNRGAGQEFPWGAFVKGGVTQIWPQSYHEILNVPPGKIVGKMNEQWKTKAARWAKVGRRMPAIVHTLSGGTRTPKELDLCIVSARQANQNEVNLWRGELLTPAHFKVIAAYTNGTKSSRTNLRSAAQRIIKRRAI